MPKNDNITENLDKNELQSYHANNLKQAEEKIEYARKRIKLHNSHQNKLLNHEETVALQKHLEKVIADAEQRWKEANAWLTSEPSQPNNKKTCQSCKYLVADYSHPCTDGKRMSNQRGFICTVGNQTDNPRMFSGWSPHGSCELHTVKAG